MITIRYDLIGAYNAGVRTHPQKDVESLGCKVFGYEGVPIADCIFMEVDTLPDNLPKWIEVSNFKIQ